MRRSMPRRSLSACNCYSVFLASCTCSSMCPSLSLSLSFSLFVVAWCLKDDVSLGKENYDSMSIFVSSLFCSSMKDASCRKKSFILRLQTSPIIYYVLCQRLIFTFWTSYFCCSCLDWKTNRSHIGWLFAFLHFPQSNVCLCQFDVFDDLSMHVLILQNVLQK